MTNDQWAAIIKFFLSCATVIGIVWRASDYLIKRDRENSVGATKIIELMDADKKIRDDIEGLQNNDDNQGDDIRILKDDYKRLMDRIWDFMGNKK